MQMILVTTASDLQRVRNWSFQKELPAVVKNRHLSLNLAVELKGCVRGEGEV